MEASITNNIFKVNNSALYYKKPFATGQAGITLRSDFNKHFSYEAGVIIHNYHGSITLQSMKFANCTDVLVKSFLVPLRLIFRQNILNKNIFLSATVGYTFGFPTYTFVGFGKFFTTSGDTLGIIPLGKPVASKNFSLLQAGLGIEFKLGNDGIFSLNANYYSGLHTLISIPINYTNGTRIMQKSIGQSKGTFLDFGISYKHPIIFKR